MGHSALTGKHPRTQMLLPRQAGRYGCPEAAARAVVQSARIVWVNGWAKMDVSMPFGGYDQSGYGRENGPEGLDEYLQTKSVVIFL